MLPNSNDTLREERSSDVFQIYPTKTYKLDTINNRIVGTLDGRDAVVQFIQKVLRTDKYAYEIYDWYYGNELLKLVGHDYNYVITRIPNILREALLVDDRIIDVRDFTFTRKSVDSVSVVCYVDTVYGEIKYEQEVAV